MEAVVDIAALKFDRKLKETGNNPNLDAISLGINLLCEELHYSAVSRTDLEKSETEFLSVFEQGSAGIVFLNSELKIIKCNQSYASFVGHPIQKLVGIDIAELIPKEDRESIIPDIKKSILWDTKKEPNERKLNRPDGSTIWCLVSTSRVNDRDGNFLYLISIFQDITQKKDLESKAISSAKFSAVGVMAAGIAHEINNPLAIIQGNAQILLNYFKSGKLPDEKTITQLEKISTTSERISKIIKGLKSFSRDGEHDAFVPSSAKTLINNVLSLCAEKFKTKSIKLEVTADLDAVIECRIVQIEQVILNLLNNAVDAIEHLTEKWIHINVKPSAESVQISVTDSGSGIPPEVVEKMLLPFFTTKEINKGTGLGLSISKNIIEVHQGRFFYDRSCSNTRFVIELPLRRK